MDGFDPDAVASTYDRVARQYAAQFSDELTRKPFDRELLDEFAVLVAGRGVVCDLGCGPGHIGRYLADRGVHVYGVDLSAAMVALARELNPGIRFEQGDARRLAVDEGSWCGVVAFYSLIHVRRAELEDVLRELRRTLERGGRLLVAVHGGSGESHVEEMLGERADLSATYFELDELSDALDRVGFAVERAIERPPYEFELQTRRVYVLARRP